MKTMLTKIKSKSKERTSGKSRSRYLLFATILISMESSKWKCHNYIGSKPFKKGCSELRVLSYIREKHQLADLMILHIWSDGCLGQFGREMFSFCFPPLKELTHPIFWYYNECHHGKEPMDGVGVTINLSLEPDVSLLTITISCSF